LRLRSQDAKKIAIEVIFSHTSLSKWHLLPADQFLDSFEHILFQQYLRKISEKVINQAFNVTLDTIQAAQCT